MLWVWSYGYQVATRLVYDNIAPYTFDMIMKKLCNGIAA